jgi:hypothetical protein
MMPDIRYPCEASYYLDNVVRRLRSLRRQLRHVYWVGAAQLVVQIVILLTVARAIK